MHQAIAGMGLSEPLYPAVKVSPEKALPVGQRSMGRKVAADVLDDIKSSLTD